MRITAADFAKKLTLTHCAQYYCAAARYYCARMNPLGSAALRRAVRALRKLNTRSVTRSLAEVAAAALQRPCSAGGSSTALVLHPVVKEVPN